MTDTVHPVTTAAGIVAEIEALRPDAGHYVVPTRTPRDDAAFLDATDPGPPPCRLPWHRRVTVGLSSTAIGTDGRIVSGPNNTGRAPRDT